ncbi:MAG: hypothetical protein RLZZ387_1698, partial [Chloroflexota bacterium]
MSYLTRIIADTRSRPVRRDLGDCHALHRTLLGGFPQAPEGAQAREHFGLLYRAEPLAGAPSLVRVLLQSKITPSWEHLPAGYLGPDLDGRGNPATRQLDGEYDQLAAGVRLFFRLRANPTKKLSDRTPGRENTLLGKRVALLREEEQLAWLARKGERHGFRMLETAAAPELPDARAAVQEGVRGRRSGRGDVEAMPLRFGAVLFEGRLEVTDRELFLTALR